MRYRPEALLCGDDDALLQRRAGAALDPRPGEDGGTGTKTGSWGCQNVGWTGVERVEPGSESHFNWVRICGIFFPFCMTDLFCYGVGGSDFGIC